jgi:hypothetical protein
MKRTLFAALAALALGSGAAQAQVPYSQPQLSNPYQRPTISPYLNMLRPNVNPALNYYGLVRPQLQTTRTLQTFQQELQTVAGALAPTTQLGTQADNLPTTGHRTTFYNYGTYFPGAGGGSLGGSLGGGVRPTFGGMSPGRPPSGTLGGTGSPRR